MSEQTTFPVGARVRERCVPLRWRRKERRAVKRYERAKALAEGSKDGD